MGAHSSVDNSTAGRTPASVTCMASLEERIAAELHRVLDHQIRGGFGVPPSTVRGMTDGTPEHPEILLTVEDVARIAANVATASVADAEKVRKVAEDREA